MFIAHIHNVKNHENTVSEIRNVAEFVQLTALELENSSLKMILYL